MRSSLLAASKPPLKRLPASACPQIAVDATWSADGPLTAPALSGSRGGAMASIKRRPDGRWRARYRDPDGREHARHFTRKSDAESWLATVQSDIVRGGYRDPAAARTTFK